MQLSSRQLFNDIHHKLQSIYPIEEARTIAFLLMEHCFQLGKAAILADKRPIHSDTSQLQDFLERLLQHEPIQYVTGKTQFYGRWFEVNPDVLIPRPETEELVHWIIEEYANRKSEHLAIMDIGTGSGCIAITLAAELPGAEVWAMDVSEKALTVAKSNAVLNKVAVNFIRTDILANSWQHMPPVMRVDIIVSNPPYVTHAEIPFMRKNVTDYEPHLALFVNGQDFLLFYRHIARFGKASLKKEGTCYVETNELYAGQVGNVFREDGFSSVMIRQDMFRKERFVKAVY